MNLTIALPPVAASLVDSGLYNRIDLLVFVGYFVAILVIGFWAGRKQESTVSGYFRGSDRLAWYTIGLSIVAAGISSEQFVGEVGYAYSLGMPVANFEWAVLPALSILLWVFVPIYLRNRVTTMPEYLQQRFGPQVRTVYALLSVASYVFVNFALVFYTGGLALEKMWGINRFVAVYGMALITGLYTVYGGLSAVAWTSSFQCILLMGGGLYVFFAGMSVIHWDFAAMLGVGQQQHLMTPASDPALPWTALVFLALSTNVWYYGTNQYINQRCLAARNQWHAMMGVLLAGALQVLLPLATSFPGMIYRVINPDLSPTEANAAYPLVVAAVVPMGLRGLVAAAVVGAIMSTISGLVNSTSTIVTLDLFQRWKGQSWSEERLVSYGRWSGAVALLIGAAFAPVVMRWESLFRYAQDIWAPMAAPTVVVFLAAAFCRRATGRGANACLWMAIATVPFTLTHAILADRGIQFLPPNLENPMVLAGTVFVVAWAVMFAFSGPWSWPLAFVVALCSGVPLVALGAWSPVTVAVLTAAVTVAVVAVPWLVRVPVTAGMWDRSMVRSEEPVSWYRSVWFWWLVMAGIMIWIYVKFW